MTKIILFGLSADPVHLGHLEYIRMLENNYPEHLIILMPCQLNPIPKNEAYLPTKAIFRLQMLNAIQKDLSNPYLKGQTIISDYETNKEGPSYTIDTIEYLQAKYHLEELIVVIGTDNLKQLPQWKNYKNILALSTLLVIKRAGVENDFKNLLQNVGYTLYFKNELPIDKSPYRHDFIFTQEPQALYFIDNNEHATKLSYSNQLDNYLHLKKSSLHLSHQEMKSLFANNTFPTLLENYFKLGKIKTLFGPQVEISSSKIREWFKEGQFEKISQMILPITYQHLRELYLQGHLVGYYPSANAAFKTLPTTKSLYQT